MIKCLISLPNHDKVTSYLYAWGKKIIESDELKGIQFLLLAGQEANKENVESYLKKQNPKVVLFNGHGSPTEICGFKNNILIKNNDNEVLLKEKIVYSLSCSSAAVLGESAIKMGVDSFIGYKKSFILCTDKNRETTPLKDDIASSFLEPSNRLSIALLKGKTTKEASHKSKEIFKKEISKYMSSKAIPGAERIAAALVWNMANQIVLGNQEAKI